VVLGQIFKNADPATVRWGLPNWFIAAILMWKTLVNAQSAPKSQADVIKCVSLLAIW
jgi:hypothetical protein